MTNFRSSALYRQRIPRRPQAMFAPSKAVRPLRTPAISNGLFSRASSLRVVSAETTLLILFERFHTSVFRRLRPRIHGSPGLDFSTGERQPPSPRLPTTCDHMRSVPCISSPPCSVSFFFAGLFAFSFLILAKLLLRHWQLFSFLYWV